MNTSLSTVDTFFNGQQLNVNRQGGSIFRSSPSFNDSEPPSYFEAIGINHVNLNQLESTNASRLSSFQNNFLPKISLETAPDCWSKRNSERGNNSIDQNTNRFTRENRIHVTVLQQNCRLFNENESSVITEITQPSETYFVWSIFTLFYCVLIGLPALIFSIKVYHYNKDGMYEKAFSRSKVAWYLNLAGLFCGIIYIGIVIVFLFFPKN